MTTRPTAEGLARESTVLRLILKVLVTLVLALLSLPGLIPIAFGFLLQSLIRRPLSNLVVAPAGAALAWLSWSHWHFVPVFLIIPTLANAWFFIALSGLFATFGAYLCQQWRMRR